MRRLTSVVALLLNDAVEGELRLRLHEGRNLATRDVEEIVDHRPPDERPLIESTIGVVLREVFAAENVNRIARRSKLCYLRVALCLDADLLFSETG